ncbi:hypothetical protein KI688_003130 [Linnemannia hyalina]|uniref:Major facilitator superfamily (MFS) profile domain-containing protein n=1 Tax=Linnemannia hyalina TaxID=64524 RepID=A0A9P8BQE8_9FUNG|nr:hypothetical protein KI688_003130 [Linnemannia hyalina]
MEATTIATSTKPLLPWYRRLNQNKGLLLALVSMAQMLDIINVASVTITLPDILKEVGYSIDQLQWVTSAYSLAYGAFLLIGGRFGDLFGHRRIYILGVTWFSIWSVVNGFAKDPVIMSVGRALQGMGAGFTVPSALAILTTTYPVGPERTFALSVFGGTGAVGSVVGVLLGGILGSTIGWRWIFYFTAILGFIMAILGFVVIPAEKGVSKIEDRRIDIFGAGAFCAGIVCIIFYLSESPVSGWASAKTLAPLIVGLVLIVSFVVIEHKIDYPIMPLRIWKSQRLIASCLIILCVSAALNAMIYFSSLLLQNVLGYTPLKTSLAYIVHGVGAIVAIVIITRIVAKVRTKIITIVGWFFFIASGIVLAQIKADSSYWSIPFPSLILNFMGMAPVWLCCQINCVADADDDDQGVVGAGTLLYTVLLMHLQKKDLYNVALQIGAPIGIAVANIVANNKNGRLAVGAELLPGYRSAFYTYAIMAGVGLVVTIIFAANSDTAKMHETTAEGVAATASGDGDEEIGHAESIDQIATDMKGSSGVASAGATIFPGSSSTSVVGGEKEDGSYDPLVDINDSRGLAKEIAKICPKLNSLTHRDDDEELTDGELVLQVIEALSPQQVQEFHCTSQSTEIQDHVGTIFRRHSDTLRKLVLSNCRSIKDKAIQFLLVECPTIEALDIVLLGDRHEFIIDLEGAIKFLWVCTRLRRLRLTVGIPDEPLYLHTSVEHYYSRSPPATLSATEKEQFDQLERLFRQLEKLTDLEHLNLKVFFYDRLSTFPGLLSIGKPQIETPWLPPSPAGQEEFKELFGSVSEVIHETCVTMVFGLR